MPMKYTSTPKDFQNKKNERNLKEKGKPHPSKETLTFLKLFARNYHVEQSMPEGLQDIILD